MLWDTDINAEIGRTLVAPKHKIVCNELHDGLCNITKKLAVKCNDEPNSLSTQHEFSLGDSCAAERVVNETTI